MDTYTNKEEIQMVSIEHQKVVGKKVLSKLQKLDIFAIIAGGAARDWKLNRVASDLDIYMYFNPEYSNSNLVKVISDTLGIEMKLIERSMNLRWKEEDLVELEKDGYRYSDNPNVRCVLEGEVDGVTIQVVLMKTPVVQVSDFCFNICQAWTKDCENILTSQEFNKGVEHKVLKITGDFYSNSEKYISKIRKKFPDYYFVG